MRPVKRALKMLENPEENTSEKDQVTQTKQVKKISILSILFELSIAAVFLSRGEGGGAGGVSGPLPRTLANNQAYPRVFAGIKTLQH